jgi:subtilisin family serine protease
MRLIRADAAWSHGRLGDPGVTVAIIDTGLDYDNRDLKTLVDLSRSASFADAWVGDTSSSNPHADTLTISDAEITTTRFPTRNPIQDYNGHGTNVGATVSSRAFAFAGVTARTTLIGVKVLGRNGQGNFGQILSGVLYAADQGADIANMSLGGAFAKAGNGRLVSLINRVFNYAKQQGMLIVTSAGNESTDLQHNGNLFASFCDAPHVVCVAAVGPTTWTGNADAPAFYTNYGRSVISVAGPGGNGILSADGSHLLPSDGWPWGAPPNRTSTGSAVWSFCTRTRMNIVGKTGVFGDLVRDAGCATGGQLVGDIGTSQAAPHVSGLAALLVAEFGKKQPQKIKQMIERTADPINPSLGKGRINVQRALGL